jgi:phospholipid-binding lipoprotein MlaA
MVAQLTTLKYYSRLLTLVAPIVMISCASHSLSVPEKTALHHGAVPPAVRQRSDPLEPLNRLMWRFNYHLLDPLLLRPMAIVWHHHLPHPLRQGISNALSNLDEFPTAVNYLLQAQLTQSLRHATRFSINTLAGLGGLIDIASYSGLPKTPRYPLGHVLGYYQLGHGPYLVLPAYGPTTPRHLTARITEQLYYFPLSVLTCWEGIGKGLLEGIERRARQLSQELILQNSSDSYLTVRESYFQWHDFVIQEEKREQGKEVDQELPQEDLDQFD